MFYFLFLVRETFLVSLGFAKRGFGTVGANYRVLPRRILLLARALVACVRRDFPRRVHAVTAWAVRVRVAAVFAAVVAVVGLTLPVPIHAVR